MFYATAAMEGEAKICAVDQVGECIFLLHSFLSARGLSIPEDMIAFIEVYQSDWTKEIEIYFADRPELAIPLSAVKLMAPIPVPRRNIVCLGQNYADHVKELVAIGGDGKMPEYPIYFSKATHTVTGPDSVILSHSAITDELDYEVELAVIIGKDGIDIPAEQAESYIFGYTIANDVSARDLQQAHQQYYKGKSLKTHCPMGPWIILRSAVSFPPILGVKTTVNGELRQNSKTDQLIFGVTKIISDLSRGYELHAGDIILTGTPGGVGISFKPTRFMKSGDEVCVTIEGIGSLTNQVQ